MFTKKCIIEQIKGWLLLVSLMCLAAHLTMWIYESWIQGGSLISRSLSFTTDRSVEAGSDSGLLQLLAELSPVCRTINDYYGTAGRRECVKICVYVCVSRAGVGVGVCVRCGKSCNVKSISSGRKLACRAFEAFVSFHLQKKKKKKLAAENLILLLQGKRGPDQQERKTEERKKRTEQVRKVRIFNVRASVFRNTELNKSSITHDQSAKDLRVFCLPILALCSELTKKFFW